MDKTPHTLKIVIESDSTKVYENVKKSLDNILNSDMKNNPIYFSKYKNNSVNSEKSLGIILYSLNETNAVNSSESPIFSIWLINPSKKFSPLNNAYCIGAVADIKFNEYSNLEQIASAEKLKNLIVKEAKEQNKINIL